MIKQIRKRFIAIAISVLALAMVLVAVIINAANWVNVRSELEQTLGFIAEGSAMQGRKGGWSRHMRNTLEESRFFSVLLREDGSLALDDVTRASDDDSDALVQIAEKALAGGGQSGFRGDYLFAVTERRDGGRAAVFLNCETKLTQVRRLALISALACAGCVLLAWLLVARFSSRAIRPMIENAERQKQFITDAGHELKTPLTVISANMDVLALEVGENEWIRSTRKQVANLRGLVGEMIYLSRLDEADAGLRREAVDLSRAVAEAAEPFVGMAEFSGKSLTLEVERGVRVTGDEAALRRLVSILCDNAVKYAPEGDGITVRLSRERRGACLTVENAIEKPLDEETLRHLFDRFYRADASRSRDSGGYGIGLSVAQAIVERHGGTIRARQEGGRIGFVARVKD